MKHSARESLSALMDNEGDELELRRVLNVLDESPDDAEHWRRYHLARSLMQRDREVDVTTDLSAGIMARIAEEPSPKPDNVVERRSGHFSFAGSAAIAAAVSLMVITGAHYYNTAFDPASDSSQPSVASRSDGSSDGQSVNASNGAQPASVASNGGDIRVGNGLEGSLSALPLFQSSGTSQGVMTVGASSEMPMFMAPNASDSQVRDQEQARLLQSYLDRHAEGSAYRSGDTWMPLLRASGNEPLGRR
ncbi:sigma-E factor negative regulatory protein [Aidingimonas lacisalsi]|uniref:sigma-E factor negative regulatory protein n=1 Tax=Aidingimonas lacisalsi TaxID=2604086 RepID=UPI0011D1C032|nr:sigma-E factor negative regulatory protein [Aidingimonas lacisalsi]